MVLWALAAVVGQILLTRARRGDAARELRERRRLVPLLWLERAAFAALVLSGAVAMRAHGWSLGHPRWLGVKLGLVAFLVVPLEAMHGYVNHVWIARGLRQTAAPPFSKDLERGIGMDDMIRTLAMVLLGMGVPLVIWLSVARPLQ